MPHICHRNELVYIRVPKTGSTAVYRACLNDSKRCGWDMQPHIMGYGTHVMLREIPKEIKQLYKHYKWVYAIRHPLTWIPSYWRWVEKNTDKMRYLAFKDGIVPYHWEQFVAGLQVTPASWAEDPDGLIEAIPYKQEDPSVMAQWAGGIDLSGPYNVTRKRRDFEPTEGIKQIIREKFHRELAHYEPF